MQFNLDRPPPPIWLIRRTLTSPQSTVATTPSSSSVHNYTITEYTVGGLWQLKSPSGLWLCKRASASCHHKHLSTDVSQQISTSVHLCRRSCFSVLFVAPVTVKHCLCLDIPLTSQTFSFLMHKHIFSYCPPKVFISLYIGTGRDTVLRWGWFRILQASGEPPHPGDLTLINAPSFPPQ